MLMFKANSPPRNAVTRSQSLIACILALLTIPFFLFRRALRHLDLVGRQACLEHEQGGLELGVDTQVKQ